MRSSRSEKARPALRLLRREPATLGLDLEGALAEEPRVLLDASFLGGLHVELAGQLGAREARGALLQLGFLHGLRDAALILRKGFGADLALESRPAAAPHLAIRLAPTGPRAAADLHFRGAWPEHREALAVAAARGAGRGPTCLVSAGYTSGWLSGLFDADVVAVETCCRAGGHLSCAFEAREATAWLEAREPGGRAWVDALPMAALREVVARHLESQPAAAGDGPADRFEPGSPVIHVWGPVMVIPFSSPEESLSALDLIGRDPGARQVRVVIVDLTGAWIDEGFGASALEQILDAIASWGAEPILAGVSPLSERVVADLEHARLVLKKDLPDAIAAGFQIAEAQRRAS